MVYASEVASKLATAENLFIEESNLAGLSGETTE